MCMRPCFFLNTWFIHTIFCAHGIYPHTYFAPISRLLTITGLFCRISSLLQGSFAKEIYNCILIHILHIMCMEWLRLVGSFKLQVSFAEYRLFYRALLQKKPIMLRSLLIVATPNHSIHCKFDHEAFLRDP